MIDIEARKKELGLSRAQFARQMDAAESWVYRVERGQIKPKNMTAPNAMRLAKILKVPLEDLLAD